MNNIEIAGIVLGLTAVASQAGLPSKFKGLFAVCIGICVSLLYSISTESVIVGIMSALSASGLWSNVKNITENKINLDDQKGDL